MVDVQKENGYTAIANAIMEALYKADLSGQEFRLTLLVLRKTYGFHKLEDAISLSQMCLETGMHHIRCSQVITRLQLMKIVTVTENINGIGKKYKFNKDFETWDTVKENINPIRKVKSTVNVLRKTPLQKTASTKERLQKKDYKRDLGDFLLPDWIPKESWDGFVDMRKEIKKSLTGRAVKLAINRLEELKAKGHDPGKVLDQSTYSKWQGLFEIKQEISNGGNGQTRFQRPGERITGPAGSQRSDDPEVERLKEFLNNSNNNRKDKINAAVGDP
jgi:phage replication O-like protein O